MPWKQSDADNSGNMGFILSASIDFLAPGGPIVRKLWPPTAAVFKAHFAVS